MISLTATTDSLILTTSSTAPLDFNATYVTLNTGAQTFVPGTNKGKVVTAVDTTIVPAPTTTDLIQAKVISITNIDPAVSNVISVSKLSTVTKYKMTPDITLLAGESFVYMHGVGWVYYASNGSIKAQQTASGTTNWIQYNAAGLLASDADFTYNPATNTFSLIGTDPIFVQNKITTEPGTPATGNLMNYNSQFSGKITPKYKAPLGMAMFYQDAAWYKHISSWYSGVAAGTTMGNTYTVAGTNALVQPTTTSLYTAMIRSTFANVITTQNQQIGLRTTTANFFRGNAAGQGGFFFACRFGITTYKTGSRLFVGMSATGNTVTGDPSSIANICGFGYDLADSAITFMHNDGSGTATKETIAGQPALASGQSYDAYVWCAPSDTTIYFRLVDGLTGALIIESSVATDLPVNTTMLLAECIMSNGTANLVAADVVLGINKMVVETER